MRQNRGVLRTAVPGRRRSRDRGGPPEGPVTPVRHGRGRPGELLHVDVKRVARTPDGGGWRARGASELGPGRSSGGPRAACPRAVVDDCGRVAYTELLPDERGGAARAFMSRCPSLFAGLGVRAERVMTVSGSCCRSWDFNALLESEGVRHAHTRPHGPRQNGRVERMGRTLAQEWQHGGVSL